MQPKVHGHSLCTILILVYMLSKQSHISSANLWLSWGQNLGLSHFQILEPRRMPQTCKNSKSIFKTNK